MSLREPQLLERERVYETVRMDIISCALMPGREIREGTLAGRFGVSKSPVRDAMQRLEAEGLVEVEPRRGYRVAQVRMEDAKHTLELRLILETAAVRRAVRAATDAELSSLDVFRTPDRSSRQSFAAENEAFHARLAVLSGNPRLAAEVLRVMEYYRRLCIVSLATLETEHDETFAQPLADHLAIIDALQTRRGAAAAQGLTRHINRSRRSVLRGLSGRAVVG